MIGVGIRCGVTGRVATVTDNHQLVTAPLSFSMFHSVTATVTGTGYNVIAPKSGKSFVITDIILGADRSVGLNGAIVDLYCATGPDEATVEISILQDEIAKQDKLILTGLNIFVDEGFWVNVKTDDNNVRANISGYYIPAVGRGSLIS